MLKGEYHLTKRQDLHTTDNTSVTAAFTATNSVDTTSKALNAERKYDNI